MAFEIKIRRGEDHHLSKLSNAQRNACRDAHRDGAAIRELARRHGVQPSTMSRVVKQPRDA